MSKYFNIAEEALGAAEDNSLKNSHEHYTIDCLREHYFVPETILPGPDDESPPAILGHKGLSDNIALINKQANIDDFENSKTCDISVGKTLSLCSQTATSGFLRSEAGFSVPIKGTQR